MLGAPMPGGRRATSTTKSPAGWSVATHFGRLFLSQSTQRPDPPFSAGQGSGGDVGAQNAGDSGILLIDPVEG